VYSNVCNADLEIWDALTICCFVMGLFSFFTNTRATRSSIVDSVRLSSATR